jgi:hypothetical protein
MALSFGFLEMAARGAAARTSSFMALSTFVVCVTAYPAVARAYTIANVFEGGCHEKLTADALRAVRLELATAAPLVANEDDHALIGDLEFSLPPISPIWAPRRCCSGFATTI